jgi:single-stranded-DNA-specific exonuclease
MRWIIKPLPNLEEVKSLAESLSVSSTIATLLCQRGINNFEEAKKFFRPNILQLHDPFLMKGMNRAVERIEEALKNGERIMVFGDYDVDGTTAVALVFQFLAKITPNLEYYIPDRYAEGYGISFTGIDRACQNGVTLIIALDCGIRSVDKVQYASEKNIDFIICDHHLPGIKIPQAIAVLDPKQNDCPYPFKELSGCGIGFKLCQALAQRQNIPIEEVLCYLDLVVTSIGADIVPIVDENRVLAHLGLERINSKPGAGIKAILDFNQIRKKLNISDVVFIIAPRINAAGRIDHGSNAVKLLIAPDELTATQFNQIVHYNNIERKSLDSSITADALEMVATDPFLQHSTSTVVFSESWHKGVVGIVASRLIENHYRPTIVLTESNGKATGSARSVRDFDLYAALDACSDLLEQWGGHKYAAGLTLKLENLDAFKKKFEEVVKSTISPEMLVPSQEIDLEIQLAEITPKMVRILKQIGPFGPQNMQPVFLTKNLSLKNEARSIGENHLRMEIPIGNGIQDFIPAIYFKGSKFLHLVENSQPFDLVYSIEENEFRDQVTLQLVIKGIRKSEA